MSGWIKLYRDITQWEWYDDHNTTRLLIHLLLTANYEDTRYKGQVICAGSRVSGLPKLSQETGLSVQQVRTSLSKLKATGEVTVKSTAKYSIITITNWKSYQEDNSLGNRQLTGNQQASNRQVTTSKEIKKERNKEKNIKGAVEKPEGVSQSVWDDFLSHRKAKKATVTETALDGIRREAGKAGWTMQDALSEICTRGWTGFKADWVKSKKNYSDENISMEEWKKQNGR